MSTRYMIAALLMTSSCVAFAQTATPRHVTARQITAVRPAVVTDAIAVTSPLAAAVTDDPSTSADVTATVPPAALTPVDPVAISQPVTGVQAAADGAALPEPSSIALMAAGLFGAVGLRRRRK